ncbi:toxin-antitoxin system YwqK family antitoxin, partial [Pontibacter silvestris]|nr:hypothetical protein [Pontibacter silvestris]
MNLNSIFWFLPFVLLLVACNGKREFEEKYVSGTGLTERIEYYPDGNIKAKGFLKDGVLDGTLKIYYPNGQLKEETNYSKGMPVGWSYEYRENGKYYRFEDRYKAAQRIRYVSSPVNR